MVESILLIHEADHRDSYIHTCCPCVRPSVRTSVPTFSKSTKGKTKQTFIGYHDCWLAAWIIDDPCLVSLSIWIKILNVKILRWPDFSPLWASVVIVSFLSHFQSSFNLSKECARFSHRVTHQNCEKHTGWHTKIGKNMHGVQGYICCFFSSQFQSGFNLLKQCAGFPNKVKNIYELFSNMLSVRPFVHPSGKQTTLKQNHATTLHGTWWVIHFEILVGPPATVSVRPSENKIALQCWH